MKKEEINEELVGIFGDNIQRRNL